jgi:hypothetical protein
MRNLFHLGFHSIACDRLVNKIEMLHRALYRAV